MTWTMLGKLLGTISSLRCLGTLALVIPSRMGMGAINCRVWVRIYQNDEEAFEIWKTEVGVPVERIKRMREADNFWTSGPTGPCGPCSELYYDFHPERGSGDGIDLGDVTRFIEFYNFVFMQYNKTKDGLQYRHWSWSGTYSSNPSRGSKQLRDRFDISNQRKDLRVSKYLTRLCI